MTGQATSTVDRPNRDSRSVAARRAYEKRTARLAGRGRTTGASTPLAAERPSRRGRLKSRIPFVAAIIGLLSAGLALTLLLTTRAAEDSYQLSDARAYNQSLVEQRAALERDYQSRNSAPELATAASELGMVPAKDPARLVVQADGTVDVVGTPAPATPGALPPLDVTPAAPAPTPRASAPVTVPPLRPTAPAPGIPVEPRNLAQSEQLVPLVPSTPATTTVQAPPEAQR